MTVAELIELLQTMPQDLPVWSYDPDIEPIHAPVGINDVLVDEPCWRDVPRRVVIRGDVFNKVW